MSPSFKAPLLSALRRARNHHHRRPPPPPPSPSPAPARRPLFRPSRECAKCAKCSGGMFSSSVDGAPAPPAGKPFSRALASKGSLDARPAPPALSVRASPAVLHPLQHRPSGSALLLVLAPLARPRALPLLLATHPALARSYLALALPLLGLPARLRALLLTAAAALPPPADGREVSAREHAAVCMVRATRRDRAPPAAVRAAFRSAWRGDRVFAVAAVAAFGALDATIAALVSSAGDARAARMTLRIPRVHAPPTAPLLHRARTPFLALQAARRARARAAVWMSAVPSTHLSLMGYVGSRLGFVPGYLTAGPLEYRRAIVLAMKELLLTDWQGIDVRMKHLMCFVLARSAGKATLSAHAAFLAHQAGASLFQLLLATDKTTLTTMRDRYLKSRPSVPRSSSTVSSDDQCRKRPRVPARPRADADAAAFRKPDRVKDLWAGSEGDDADYGYDSESLSEVDEEDDYELNASGDDDDDDAMSSEADLYDYELRPSSDSSSGSDMYDDIPIVNEIEAPRGQPDEDLFVVEEDMDGQERLRLTGVIFSEREVALLLFAHSARSEGVPRLRAAEAAEMRRLFSPLAAVEAAGVVACQTMLEQWTGVCLPPMCALEAPVRRFVQGPIGARLKLGMVGQRGPARAADLSGLEHPRGKRTPIPRNVEYEMELFELYKQALVQPLR